MSDRPSRVRVSVRVSVRVGGGVKPLPLPARGLCSFPKLSVSC